MRRRWIIRRIFLGLLLLGVGLWMWSALYWSHIGCHEDGGFIRLTLAEGAAMLTWGREGEMPEGWYGHARPAAGFQLWPGENPAYRSWLGFRMGYQNETAISRFYYVGVPHWFVVAVLAGMLAVAWRKTRETLQGPAFPVEIRRPAQDTPS